VVQVHQEPLVLLEQLVLPEGREVVVPLEFKVVPDHQEPLVLLVPLEQMVPLALQGVPDQLELQVPMARPEVLGEPELLVRPAQLVRLE
jgi:hypothetical protein